MDKDWIEVGNSFINLNQVNFISISDDEILYAFSNNVSLRTKYKENQNDIKKLNEEILRKKFVN